MRRALFFAILLVLQAPSSYSASLDDEIRKLAGLAKSGTNVKTESYDVKGLSIKAEAEEMRPRFSAVGKECRLQPVFGRGKEVALHIDFFDAFLDNGDAVQALVKKLTREKKFLGAVGFYWDGLNGPEEKCSTEYLSMYFSNGRALVIESDY